MEEFKRRLMDFARTQYNMGQSLFEDHCGVNRGLINSIKVKGPSAEIIMKISRACPELNLNWLFRGDEGGSMLNAQEQKGTPTTADSVKVQMLEKQVEQLTQEKDNYWDLIQKLTAK